MAFFTSDSGLGSARPPTSTCLVILAAVSLCIFLLKANSLPLTDPDESRCAEIVQNMLVGGDWLVPHRNGQIYFDKPAPFFWLAAGVQYVTGSMELGGRFVAAIAGTATVLITFLLARRISNNLTALFAGIFLATGPEFFFVARWYRMDMPFTVFMWAALWWFWTEDRGQGTGDRKEGGSRTAPTRHGHVNAQWVGFYLFCALATLMKGPAGAALPVMVVAAYFVISKNWRRIFEFFNVWGILVYLLIAAPWYIVVSLTVPNYAYQFFIEQNLGRYTGSESYGHHFPGIAYVGIVFGGMMPWAIFLPAAVEKKFPWRWSERTKRPEILFLWTAALVPLIFFAFCKSKMPNYILPVFGPLAILVAMPLVVWATSEVSDKAYRHAAAVLCGVLFLTPAAFVWIEWRFAMLGLGTILWTALLLVSAAECLLSFLRRRRVAAINWACMSATIAILCFVMQICPALYEMMSQHRFAAPLRNSVKSGDAVCFVDTERESFSLYSGCDRHYRIKAQDPNDRKMLAELLASKNDVYMLVSGDKNMDFLKGFSKKPLYTIAANDKGFFEIFGYKFSLGRKFYVVTTAKKE
jgi:4-amino-4-deoxy-L-arabinose transferase-like glycosyltransferase